MKKVVRIFRSFEEADAADVEADLRRTPEERIQIVLDLQTWMHRHAPPQGFERVYRIVQLQQS